MFDLHLTAEQLEIRRTVRDFVNREIKPIAMELDRLERFDRQFPPEVLDKASGMGLRTLALSEALGGAGADRLTGCLVAEELAVGDVGIASTLIETSMLAHQWFDEWMTPEQRKRFRQPFLADDRFQLALANHEPGDASHSGWNYHAPEQVDDTVRATAIKDPLNGNWILNGTKDLVRNGESAKLFAVEVLTDARTSGLTGVQTILVPRDAPGLRIRDHDKNPQGARDRLTFGFYHGARSELVLENCRVPRENLLDASRKPVAMSVPLPEFQAINIGIGRAACEAGIEYAKLRVQGGQPIVQHQGIGNFIADMAIRLEAARNLVWHAAWACDHPDAVEEGSVPGLPLATIAGVFTSEAIHKVTLDATHIFGGSGVMRDLPIQKYVRDGLIFLHSQKNNSIARFRIAEAVVGYRNR